MRKCNRDDKLLKRNILVAIIARTMRAKLMFESEYLWQKLIGKKFIIRVFKSILVAIKNLIG